MSKISSFNQVKKYINKEKSIKAQIREWKRQLPTIMGKHLMKATRQPMFNKEGDPVTYKTSNGTRKQRYRYIHDWNEFQKLYKIVPRKNNNKKANQNGNGNE